MLMILLKQNKNVEENTHLLKSIKDKLEEMQLIQPYLVEEIQNLVKVIHWQSEKLEIKKEFLSKRFRSKRFLTQFVLSFFLLILGLPLFIFGLIQSVIPYQLTSFLMPKLVKNVEYYAPIAILLGLVFYPLNYILFLHFVGDYFEFDSIGKIVYFVAMPLTGMIAFQFVQYLKNISFKWKYVFQIVNQNEALKELRKLQSELKKIITVQ